MKINYALIILLLLMAGCANNAQTNNQAANNVQANNQATQPVLKDTLAKMFDYASVKSFSYRINTDLDGARNSVDVNYDVKLDTFNGQQVWLTESSTVTETGTLVSRMWIDKTTTKCLVTDTQMRNGDVITPQPSICPLAGPNSIDTVTSYVSSGQEDISIPLGTYTADKYSINGVTYWVAKNVPLPLQVQYDDGTEKMVLTGYN
jgi:outer membrane murein-binding lipoprotein Lpp